MVGMKNKLDKKLTTYGLTMIAVGSCIGSGIFITPSQIVSDLQSPWLVLLVWIVGGVVALTGALTFAELGGLFPKTGGVYVFLREAYGPLVAFFYGWSILLVVTSGAIAALSLAFAQYLSTLFPSLGGHEAWFGATAILVLSCINIFGVHLSQFFSNFFTGIKLLGIAAIILIGLTMGDMEIAHVFSSRETQQEGRLSWLFVALIGVLWSYGGWQHASYLGGESVSPAKSIPRAMVLGALIVTVVYVATNLAYMLLLPIDQIAESSRVAADAITTILPAGGVIIALLIALSVFGTAGIYTTTAPRLYLAMAQDGVLFKGFSSIHPRYHTPVNAILLQAAWAIVLLFFWETFSNLITYVVFIDWIFMALAAASVYIFRKKLQNVSRPYKTLGYPAVPMVFILISVAFLISTLIEKPAQAWAGIVLMISGLPFYFYCKRKYLSQ